MKDGKLESLKEARDWFSDKGNNKDRKGVICVKPDGSSMRAGTLKEAESFFQKNK